MKSLRKIALLLVLVLTLSLFGAMTVTAETTEDTTTEPAPNTTEVLVTDTDYDFDADSALTVADITMLIRRVDGWDDGYIAELAGDVNGDGKTSIYDVVCLLRVLARQTSLKVVTYNIKCAIYGETMEEIAATLKEVNADVVGLQEVDRNNYRSYWKDQMKELAAMAGYEYYFFAPVVGKPGDPQTPLDPDADYNAYGHGILSKYPIIKSEIIWPEAQTTITTNEIRNVERHEIQVGDKVLTFYNSHMDFSEGRYQYKEIQDDYMMKDEYAVFVGDMNEKIYELEESGCIDYENFDILTDKSKIDHIIVKKDTISGYKDPAGVSGFMVESTTLETPVTRDSTTFTKASDHNLWYSYINLK